MALCKFPMSLKMLKTQLKKSHLNVFVFFIKTYDDWQVCSGQRGATDGQPSLQSDAEGIPPGLAANVFPS